MPTNSSLLTGSTRRLLDTFLRSSIPCEVVYGDLNIIRYQTKRGEWRQLRGMVSEKLPLFSRQICDDKWWTVRVFKELGMPTPKTVLLTNDNDINLFLSTHSKVVIKPREGAHGHGVTMNASTHDGAVSAVELARQYDKQVLLQEQIVGSDIRLLAIGGEIISALERRPASVFGDGIHSVAELIAIENKKPERGEIGIDTLVKISLPAARQFLTAEEMSAVPTKGTRVRVVGPSNQSMGGSVHDITNRISPAIRNDTMRIVRHLNMPIAGVDCIATEDGYYFLEINASPGIAIHDDPEIGIESGCFKAYMDLLHEDAWWRV